MRKKKLKKEIQAEYDVLAVKYAKTIKFLSDTAVAEGGTGKAHNLLVDLGFTPFHTHPDIDEDRIYYTQVPIEGAVLVGYV